MPLDSLLAIIGSVVVAAFGSAWFLAAKLAAIETKVDRLVVDVDENHKDLADVQRRIGEFERLNA